MANGQNVPSCDPLKKSLLRVATFYHRVLWGLGRSFSGLYFLTPGVGTHFQFCSLKWKKQTNKHTDKNKQTNLKTKNQTNQKTDKQTEKTGKKKQKSSFKPPNLAAVRCLSPIFCPPGHTLIQKWKLSVPGSSRTIWKCEHNPMKTDHLIITIIIITPQNLCIL